MQIGSRGVASYTTGSRQSPGETSEGVKPLKNFGLFISGRQINSLK